MKLNWHTDPDRPTLYTEVLVVENFATLRKRTCPFIPTLFLRSACYWLFLTSWRRLWKLSRRGKKFLIFLCFHSASATAKGGAGWTSWNPSSSWWVLLYPAAVGKLPYVSRCTCGFSTYFVTLPSLSITPIEHMTNTVHMTMYSMCTLSICFGVQQPRH